ncbi:GNAT family N-acetyltransferase [Streptomyces sp. NPDC053069]|uniref:GNAT family N-acetyltransferase n=1 Tax=Streptomyces sp. NPDC053069 TaxID=3365695 RepID=UPI0037D70C7C
MRPDDWYLTEDLDEFLARAGDFLRSRPALHTVPLTVADALRRRGLHLYGPQAPLFGLLEADDGTVRATLVHTPPFHVHVTALTPQQADTLAARYTELDRPLPGVSGPQETAEAFAAAWQRHTGTAVAVDKRQRLYRLDELTAPEPRPQGRARIAGPADRELLVRWFKEFQEITGGVGQDAGNWADGRISYGGVTLWEAADGTPLAMAGATPETAGQVRIAPVYTPADLRGRGYAGAVTAEVSRAAREAGVAEILLFTDLDNPTSNGLYQRIGYRPVADFTVWGFGGAER